MERQCKYARHISIYLEKNDSLDEDKLPKFPSSFEMWRPTPNTGTAHRCFLDILRPILSYRATWEEQGFEPTAESLA